MPEAESNNPGDASLESACAADRRAFPARPYDLLPVGHLAASPEGSLLRANPSLATMLGYASLGELARSCRGMAQGLWEEPADWQALASLVETRGELERYPASLRRRDGVILPCAVWARRAAWPWAGTEVLEVLVQSEIERHQVFSALTQVLRLHRDMMDLNPNPVLIHEKCRILMANPAAEAFFHSPGRGALVGRTAGDLLHPRCQGDVLRHIRVASTGRPATAEFLLVLAGGEERWVRYYSAAITYHRRPAILTLLYDRTDRRRAETALAEAERLYRTIVETSPSPIAIHVPGRLLYGNPALARFYRLGSVAELMRRPLDELVDEETGVRIKARIEALFKGNVSEEAIDIIRLRSGEELHHQVSTAPIQYQGQRCLLSTLHDLTAYHAAVQARDEAERLHRTVLESMPEAVCLHDDGRILYANPCLRRLFCLEGASSPVGRRLTEFLHPDSLPDYHRRRAEVLAGQGESSGEYPLRFADGRLRHVADITLPVTVWGREVFLVIIRDVTERREAQQARDEAEALYRTIVETSPDPIFIYNPEGLLYANQASARFYQLGSVAELLRMRIDDLVDEESAARLKARIQSLYKGTADAASVSTIRLRNGEARHTHVSTVFITYQGRRCLLTALHDLTPYRRAEAERDQALARYEDLFQSAPLGIVMGLPDGRLARVNRRMAEIFGYASPEAMTAEVASIPLQLYADPADYVRLRRLAEHQGEVKDFECLARRRDGTRFWTSRSVRAVRVPEGGVEGFEVYVRDISERREAKEEAAERGRRVQVLAGELAMASERERRSMARDLHDGPVQQLALATLLIDDLARKGGREGEFAPALDLLRETARQLRAALDDLTPPALFADSLAGALACLGRDFDSRHGLAVEVFCPDLPDLSREAVAFLCRTVRELLVNAVKHGRAQRAAVQVDVRGRSLWLMVADEGRGFDPGLLERAGVFSQGLPGLRCLARDLGGGMAVDSSPGLGTRVVLDLPLDPLCAAQPLLG